MCVSIIMVDQPQKSVLLVVWGFVNIVVIQTVKMFSVKNTKRKVQGVYLFFDNMLSICIQTSGKRPRHTKLLMDLLKDEIIEKKLEDVSIRIVQGDTLWGSCRDCLLSASSGHILVLQDDVLPCKDFIETVLLLTELHANEIVTLFSNSDSIETARLNDLNYARLKVWFMAQAYVLDTINAKNMVAWIDVNCKEDIKHDDDRMATYIWYQDKTVIATAPSLVEHIGWNTTTLTTYKKKPFEPRLRMAKWYIGFEESGLSIKWERKEAVKDMNGDNSMFCSNLKK